MCVSTEQDPLFLPLRDKRDAQPVGCFIVDDLACRRCVDIEDAGKWSSASHALKAGSLSPLQFRELAYRGRQLLASLASTEACRLTASLSSRVDLLSGGVS
ncbi:hypothetical protein [Bradyrhizobium sp. S3.2.12]|uniref:hypothetical protein n=1 Tax=Bradyrhizobium sp. S3.2.12 TaxID=3156387 RepID=UPI003396304B